MAHLTTADVIDRCPTLSVVIATVHGGAQLATALGAVTEQTLAVGGEVLLATSRGARVSGEIARFDVRTLEVESTNVFALRAAGIAAARGEVIALTEDHVVVGPAWADATLRAHTHHAEAALIGGPVDNGSRRRLIDWANFLMTFGSFLPPISARRHGRMPVIANLSIKRAALPAAALAPGELEFRLLPRLAGEHRIAFDDGPLVWHVQSHGARTALVHFHNGRATTGMARPNRRRLDLRRRGSLRRLRTLTRDALVTLTERPLPSRARASLPLLMLLCTAHVAGEWVGATFGPGRSAEHLA